MLVAFPDEISQFNSSIRFVFVTQRVRCERKHDDSLFLPTPLLTTFRAAFCTMARPRPSTHHFTGNAKSRMEYPLREGFHGNPDSNDHYADYKMRERPSEWKHARAPHNTHASQREIPNFLCLGELGQHSDAYEEFVTGREIFACDASHGITRSQENNHSPGGLKQSGIILMV